MELNKILCSEYEIYAHITEGKEAETLQQHIERCKKYLERLLMAKKLDCIVETFLREYMETDSQMSMELARKIWKRMITFHDVGKINPEFQRKKWEERIFDLIGCEEYRVQVGGSDFYIDLLFYNRALSCLVPVELKIGKFKPEHVGQINFYLEALDRQKKKENENPSVGMILCASKDDEVVEYAMSRTLSPMMVAEYQLQLPDKNILQKKLQELINMPLLEDE